MIFEIPDGWKQRPEVDAAAYAALVKRLEKPKGIVDVVLDTDTFNEIDDQFALAYLVKKKELNVKAICAAPFFNSRSTGPGDGMEKSYEEILRVLGLMKRDDLKSVVYRGSNSYLPSETEPVVSEAAEHLVKLASNYSADKPLYVVAIGAITNVASALLLKPEIKEKIVVVWLGGHAHDWHNNTEFNLYQDVAAARIIFGCCVPLVQLPCMGVVSSFTTSGPELEYWLRGKNELCDYLVDVTTTQAVEDSGISTWTRVIWDVTAVAWLLGGDFMLDRIEPSPIPEYDNHYAFNKTRHPIRYVFHINRDLLFEDLFRTLAK
ncbi:MAG: nucleoside hydrolase [Oscillospiraceae bacterium]|jgi:inosine-uridine nucleoside N-ribohydrolase|nr:nucleoside hydrolase [Oscillospiraceae bacterium]